MSDEDAVAAGYIPGGWDTVLFDYVIAACEQQRAIAADAASAVYVSAAVEALFHAHVAALLRPALALVATFDQLPHFAVGTWFTRTAFPFESSDVIEPQKRTHCFVSVLEYF